MIDLQLAKKNKKNLFDLFITSGGTNFKVPAFTCSFTFPLDIPDIPKSIT